MDTIEQEIQAKGLTAPRVTPADLEAEIVAEFCFMASTGAKWGAQFGDRSAIRSLEQVTLCILVLRNGLTIVGKNYGPVDPDNFDPEKGRDYARGDALEQIWPLLGFRLADRLAAEGHNQSAVPPHVFRMRAERDQLDERLKKLCAFLDSETFRGLDDDERASLESQAKVMTAYFNILQQRVEKAEGAVESGG